MNHETPKSKNSVVTIVKLSDSQNERPLNI
jgi:hypothetical protein